MRPLFHRPRWLHRLIATSLGYFWQPCPGCGRYWGGHEYHGVTELVGVRDIKTTVAPDGLSATFEGFRVQPGELVSSTGEVRAGVCPWCAARTEKTRTTTGR